jgi:hypothetical protein
MVYVYDKNNKSYEPCSNAMARKLLKDNYAKVVNKKPFSIQLNFQLDELYEDIIDSDINSENNTNNNIHQNIKVGDK